MTQFSYSFCMAMLHSFWQAALLVLLYITVDKIVHKNNAPLAKRNFLYSALAAQLVLFSLTFSIYYFDARGLGNFAAIMQDITTTVGAERLQLITPWIFGVYIFIIIYRLVKALFGWQQFKQQYKNGLVRPGVELKLFTELKAYHFGIRRKVKLWLSTAVHTPVTFGYFKPIILLPVSLLNNISIEQAETLILHELTHIRTNDYLLNWFLVVAETIFFFNPFISSLCKQIRLEREKNCDMHVMSFAYSPALYAETLLQAERMKQLVPDFQLAAVNTKKQLLQRIQFFTHEKVLNQTLRFNIVAPLIGLLLLLMLSTALLVQSGKAGLPMDTASDLRYIPFNNYMVSGIETGRPIYTKARETAEISTLPVQEIPLVAAPAKAKTGALPALVLTEPKMEEADEEMISSPVEMNFAHPVAGMENDAARRIIVKEEGSGTASVKVYYLSFENGKWILQPEWTLTAKEINTDSLSTKPDTLQRSIRKIYPAQQ